MRRQSLIIASVKITNTKLENKKNKYVHLRGRPYIHTGRSYAWPARWMNWQAHGLCMQFCVCVFVWLWISLPRIKLAASNFARQFIGVLGRESHILGNFAPQKPKIDKSASARATRTGLHAALAGAGGSAGILPCQVKKLPDRPVSDLNIGICPADFLPAIKSKLSIAFAHTLTAYFGAINSNHVHMNLQRKETKGNFIFFCISVPENSLI